jgi:hypothetical protein
MRNALRARVNAGASRGLFPTRNPRAVWRRRMHDHCKDFARPRRLSWRGRMLAALALSAGMLGNAAAADRPWDRDGNPPGPRGGPGTNWENPPGWRGGPGASPDRRYWRHGAQRHRFDRIANGYYFSPAYGYWHPAYGFWNQAARCWRDRDDNPPGPRGGRGTNWENPPGWRGGPGASPDRYGRCR